METVKTSRWKNLQARFWRKYFQMETNMNLCFSSNGEENINHVFFQRGRKHYPIILTDCFQHTCVVTWVTLHAPNLTARV